MHLFSQKEASGYMNWLGRNRRPFLFLIDFEQDKPVVLPLEEIDPEVMRYQFPGRSTPFTLPGPALERIEFSSEPVPFTRYAAAFELVQEHIRYGDSFLLNLTFPSKLRTNLTTRQIFQLSEAPYRLWWEGHFVCFSPETFVRIRGGRIFSYPMKGTITDGLPNAPQLLLDNPKEQAEHATIVDLIRNDLSQVARQVRVERYRYFEKITTRRGGIWQSSSEISGLLPLNYHEQIGDLIFRLLPAGSISGAPKPKTVEIIQTSEGSSRGYYTGIAGIFDGCDLDSAVLIRFVEERPDGLWFRSGGGITASSRVEEEYMELISKVDLPISATGDAVGHGFMNKPDQRPAQY